MFNLFQNRCHDCTFCRNFGNFKEVQNMAIFPRFLLIIPTHFFSLCELGKTNTLGSWNNFLQYVFCCYLNCTVFTRNSWNGSAADTRGSETVVCGKQWPEAAQRTKERKFKVRIYHCSCRRGEIYILESFRFHYCMIAQNYITLINSQIRIKDKRLSELVNFLLVVRCITILNVYSNDIIRSYIT